MPDPRQSPTCYLDVAELGDFVGGVSQSDWPTALRMLKAASRTIDDKIGRFIFQLEAVTFDLDVISGQHSFFPPYDLLTAPTGLLADVNGDTTYSEDLVAAGAIIVLLGEVTPYYGFQVREIGVPVRGTKALRASGINCGWPRDSEVVNGQTVQDDPLSASATTLIVQDASKFEVGQTLTFGSSALGQEQVFVSDRPTTTTLTIERGINGTTAVEQANDTAIYRLKWPYAIYLITGVVAARMWRKRDTAFANVYTDEGPRLPAGPLLDDDDLERLARYMRTEIG